MRNEPPHVGHTCWFVPASGGGRGSWHTGQRTAASGAILKSPACGEASSLPVTVSAIGSIWRSLGGFPAGQTHVSSRLRKRRIWRIIGGGAGFCVANQAGSKHSNKRK